jgi:cystathionine gamma-synthase/O-acetylhomoserine (thiol)-lyase
VTDPLAPGRGFSTRATHPPEGPALEQRPSAAPTYRTASFIFESAEEYADILAGTRAGYSYSRLDNPTADAFAAAVAALEGADSGQALASGMAAISTTLLAHLRAGDHVVAQSSTYGGTYSLLAHVLPRYGITTTFVDITDLDQVAGALTPATRIVYAETLANPLVIVANLPGLAAIAHEAGALLVVDSTFASPRVCRPLEWGVDLVLHSATKYLGGHSDVTGGVVVGAAEHVAPVRTLRGELGAALAPDEAFLLQRGLLTLAVRMDRHCSNALTFAEAVAGHPAVTAVDYPGLPDNRSHELARKLFSVGPEGQLYGAVVTIAPAGGREAGMAFCNALQLVRIATSLGGIESKVSHIASTTHRQLDDRALRAAGIAPSAVRISIGLEDVNDIVADVRQALDRV